MAITFSPGRYVGKGVKIQLGKAKTGNPQIAFSFIPTGKIGPNDKIEPCPNFERTIFRVLTENTIEYVIQDLQRIGYTHESFEFLDCNHPQAFNFEGVEIHAECKHDNYEGKENEKWQFVGGGLQVVPLERKEVSKLDAMFGKHLKAANAQAKPAGRPAPRQPVSAGKTTEEQADETF